jgi:hypothetical protein
MFSVDEIAIVVYEAIRGYNHAIGDPWLDPPWPGANHFHRGVTVSGVSAVRQGASPQELHENWFLFYSTAGWVHGKVKNPVARPPTHPSLLTWDDLPVIEQQKYELFRDVVLSMSRIRLFFLRPGCQDR